MYLYHNQASADMAKRLQMWDKTPHQATPIVKWAGGKRQLLRILKRMMPKVFGAYYEPCVGGGAVLFSMLRLRPRGSCHATDINSDLISTYLTVRDHIDELIYKLKEHDSNFRANRKEYYYQVRAQDPSSQQDRAARLIFLNRTCFNGLYRVNKSGKFNVPMGSYVNPKIVNESNLRRVSRMLKEAQVTFQVRDFSDVLSHAKLGDLVYFDPPYHPISRTSSFTSYTDANFSYKDLCRLAEVCRELDEMGCCVMHSNSCAPEVSALFTDKTWNVTQVKAARMINSDGGKRVGHHELVITNF